MHVLVKRIRSKVTVKRWRHHFPYYKSMGTFCCHGHQSFDPICLKTLSSLSPPPVMLHIKFDQDWPNGLIYIQVRKCKISVFQRTVTPKWVVWSGPKSNFILWMMNFIQGLNREKNTPTFRKDEIGLKLKLHISTFYFPVLTCPESVASYCKMGR